MAESTGCGMGPATTRGCSPATTTRSSQGRRGGGSPARAARHCRGVGAGRTPGPLSAHPGDQESPPAAGQGTPGPLCPQNAARERSRVQALRRAFLLLQEALPTVPPGTKLSKLDVLILATSYIAHLSHALGRGPPPPVPSRPLHGHQLLHPLKKWPMRSRLYASPWGGAGPDPSGGATATSSQEHTSLGDSRLARGESPPLTPPVLTATGAPTSALSPQYGEAVPQGRDRGQ